MYCPNCGQQQVDGAKFCSNCGKQIPATDILTESDPEKWEVLEITAEQSGAYGVAAKYMLVAHAVGPSGRYTPYERGPEFIVPSNMNVYQDYTGIMQGQDALNSLIESLTDDGWEPLPRGQYWYSYRFKRSFKRAIEEEKELQEKAWVEAEQIYNKLTSKGSKFLILRNGDLVVKGIRLDGQEKNRMKRLLPFLKKLINPDLVDKNKAGSNILYKGTVRNPAPPLHQILFTIILWGGIIALFAFGANALSEQFQWILCFGCLFLIGWVIGLVRLATG